MKKEFITIIGAGWLGRPLCLSFLAQGFEILATTAHDKSAEFALDGIPYTSIDVATQFIPDKIINSDVLIYLIPPLGVSHVKKFFDQIPADKKIIFASSTSVYGKNMNEVDEDSELFDCSTGSPILFETENYLRKRFSNATILRFGGLYGDKRHPVFFLKGKEEVTGAHELTHLVERTECIDAITSVLKKGFWGQTFNIVSDLRMPKKEYYVMMAEKFNLTPPKYNFYERSFKETNIKNTKSKILLGMKYSDPSEFYTSSV